MTTESGSADTRQWVEYGLRYADGRISPQQDNLTLDVLQDFAARHDLTVVSRTVTATEWEPVDA